MAKRRRAANNADQDISQTGAIVIIVLVVIIVAGFAMFIISNQPRPVTRSTESTPLPTSTRAPSSNFVCPSTCDEAVRRGVSAQQAANCGLDNDGDGKACYGD